MGQDVRFRKQTTVNYEANGVVSEKLSRGMVYRELYVKLVGQLDRLTTENTQALTLKGDEWACVKKIEIIANNVDVLWSLTGNQLWWFNYYQMGNRPHITPAIGSEDADPSFATVLMIPFWMPRAIRPIDTALDARNLSDLQIRVTWGDDVDIQASAAPAWLTEPTLHVYSLESTKVKGPFATQRVYYIEKVISATTPQFQVTLPVGPVYRSFLFNTESVGKDAGAILNNVKLKSGTTIFVDLPEMVLEQANGWLRNGTVHTFDDGAGLYDPARRGSTYNVRAGWRFLDLVTDNFLTEALDSLGFSELELELDVTVVGDPTKLFIIPQTIIPVRGKA